MNLYKWLNFAVDPIPGVDRITFPLTLTSS